MSAVIDRQVALQAVAEDVLKSAGVGTGAAYKAIKNRSGLAGYFLSLSETGAAQREVKIRDVIAAVGGNPTEGVISAISAISKEYGTITAQPYYSTPTPTSTVGISPTATYTPFPTYSPPTATAPSEKKSEESSKSKKTEKDKDKETESTTPDVFSRTNLVADNLQTATLAHLQQVTGIQDESVLTPLAATISAVKITSPDISTEELEVIIEDQILVLEAAGHKVSHLNSATPPPPAPSWDEVNQKLVDSLSETDRYSGRTEAQLRNVIDVQLKVVQGEVITHSQGKGTRAQAKLDERIRRDIDGYLGNTFSHMGKQEKEAALGIGLRNFIIYEAAGHEMVRREIEEPSTLASFMARFNVSADGDELLQQTIQAQAMSAGLNLDTARDLSNIAKEHLTNTFSVSASASPLNFDPKKPTTEQTKAFIELNQRLDEALAVAYPELAQVLKRFRVGKFDLNQVHAALVHIHGNPSNAPKAPDASVAHTLNSIAPYITNNLDPIFIRMVNTYIGSTQGQALLQRFPQLKGFQGAFGLREARLPQYQSLTTRWKWLGADGGFGANDYVKLGKSTPLYQGSKFVKDGVIKLGGKAWAKFAATEAGKKVVGEITKFAAKRGISAALAAAGSFAPVIGNAIGWVLGEVVSLVGEMTLGALKKFADNILGVIGLSTDDLFKAGLIGGLAGVALGSAGLGLVVGGGALIGFGGIVAIVTLVIAAIFLPLIITVLGTPVVLALFLHIINSGAYIVPPSASRIVGPPGPGPGPGPIPYECQASGSPPPTNVTVTYSPNGAYAFPVAQDLNTLWYSCTHWNNQIATDIGYVGYTQPPPPSVNASVVAYTSGTIVYSSLNDPLGGKNLILSGNDGRFYYYAHNCDLYVTQGDSVTVGEVIATTDNTGEAATTVEHSHFGISNTDTFFGGGTICPATDFQEKFGLFRCAVADQCAVQ